MTSDAFYAELFTRDPFWSTPAPNLDEARRLARVCEMLSLVAQRRIASGLSPALRILDVGCGRGWLTHAVSAYGVCEGIDPVAGVIDHARRLFPTLQFTAGLAGDLLPHRAHMYDVIVASEVIEHVPDGEKGAFLEDLGRLLKPGGHLILTTPRGEYYRRWRRLGSAGQPVEDWLTERVLSRLLRNHGFLPQRRTRVHVEIPRLSLLHRVCASERLQTLAERLGFRWVLEGLRFTAGLYQVWLFEFPGAPRNR